MRNQMDCQGNALSTEVRIFDSVAVCTGQPSKPRACSLENVAKFEGVISHSKTHKDATPFQNSRVLVVGTGESASDVVDKVAAALSKPVAVSQR
jgi:putative flavoprotein involved in K+ transport